MKKLLVERFQELAGIKPLYEVDSGEASKELIDFGKEVQKKLQTVENAFKFKIDMNAANFNMFNKVAQENTDGFAILGQGNKLAIVSHPDNKQLLQDVISKFNIADNFDAVLDDSTKKAISDTSYEISTKSGELYFENSKMPGVIDTNGVIMVTVGVNGRAIRKN